MSQKLNLKDKHITEGPLSLVFDPYFVPLNDYHKTSDKTVSQKLTSLLLHWHDLQQYTWKQDKMLLFMPIPSKSQNIVKLKPKQIKSSYDRKKWQSLCLINDFKLAGHSLSCYPLSQKILNVDHVLTLFHHWVISQRCHVCFSSTMNNMTERSET